MLLKKTNNAALRKAEKISKSRNDRKKTEKTSKSRIFLLKAEEVAALILIKPLTYSDSAFIADALKYNE